MKSFRMYLTGRGQTDREDRETRPLKLVKALALLAIAGAHLWFIVDGVTQGRTFFFWRRASWGLGHSENPIVRFDSPKAYWATLGFDSVVLAGAGAWAAVTLRQARHAVPDAAGISSSRKGRGIYGKGINDKGMKAKDQP